MMLCEEKGDYMIDRRRFCLAVGIGAAAGRATAAKKMNVRFGTMQGSLPKGEAAETFAAAKRIGLAGVEFNLGRELVDGKLPFTDPSKQQAYLDAAKANGLAIAGVVLDVFHPKPLKSDPEAPSFIDPGLEIARKMNARVLLLPFFGKAALANREEMGRCADILKEHLGAAKKAGIVMGLEDTISAEDNAWMLDRIGSAQVKVYYDIGNSTNNGFDPPKEIRWLGGKRICQIHIKDRPYLGEGKVDVVECMRAIRDSGYEGFINFETSAPSGDREADLRKNFEVARAALQKAEAE
jgi:sugar phosphate isomerase/epimerase